MQPSSRLFVYGTLLFAELRALVAGRSLEAREAVLPGYRRRALRNAAYPGVVRAPGESTPGLLLEAVDAQALARIDRFEGSLYARRRLSVRIVGRPGFVHAAVYVVPPARRGVLADAAWDPRAFAEAHLAGYLEACGAIGRAEARRLRGA